MQPSARPSTAAEPVGLLVGAARSHLRQASGAVARRFGLPPQQFWVLVHVLEADGPSVGGLAERLRSDMPTASRLVAGLVRRRLARIEHDAADGRRARVVPTAKAAGMAPRLRAAAAELRAAVVEGLSSEELEALRAGLRHVIANMERFVGRSPVEGTEEEE